MIVIYVKYCQVLFSPLGPLEKSDFDFIKFFWLEILFQFELFVAFCFPPSGAFSVVSFVNIE